METVSGKCEGLEGELVSRCVGVVQGMVGSKGSIDTRDPAYTLSPPPHTHTHTLTPRISKQTRTLILRTLSTTKMTHTTLS